MLDDKKIIKRLMLDSKSVPWLRFFKYGEKYYTLKKIFKLAIDGKTGARVILSQFYFEGEYGLSDKQFALDILNFEVEQHPNIDKSIILLLQRFVGRQTSAPSTINSKFSNVISVRKY